MLRRITPLLVAVTALLSGSGHASEPVAPTLPPIVESPLESEWDAALTYLWLSGELALRQGHTGEALAAFRTVAERTARPDALHRYAQTALLLGDSREFERALLLWEFIATDDPQLPAFRAHRERLRERFERQLSERIAALLAANPEQIETNLLSLIPALDILDDPEQTLRLIEQVTRPYAHEASAHLIYAQAARAAGDLDHAWAAIQRALSLRPAWGEAWLLYAQIALERFRAAEALPAVAEAHRNHPTDSAIALAHATLLAEIEPPGDPYPLVTPHLSNPSPSPRLIALLVQWGSQGISPATAERLLLKLQSHEPRVRLLIAQMWLDRRQPRLALEHLQPRHTKTLDPNDTLSLRTQALAMAGRIDEALFLLNRRLDTHDPILAQARLLQKAERLADARTLLAEALTQEGDDPTLLYEYALILDQMGERHAAEGYLRKLLALRPLDPHAMNALGYLLADRGQELDEAERLLTTALALKPNDGYILDSVGWLRFRQGRYSEARRLLERAWNRAQEREIGEHLVALYRALGLHERADQLHRRLERQFPRTKTP